MQATQHAQCGARVIVLNEIHLMTHGVIECAPVLTFHEKATLVAKNLRLDEEHFGEGSRGDFH